MENKRIEAAKAVAPRFKSSINEKWLSSGNSVKKSQASDDARDVEVPLEAVLVAVSRGDTTRAGEAIGRILSDSTNSDMREVALKFVTKKEDEHLKLCKLLVDGIKDSNAHHNAIGSRTKAAETFVKNNVTACVFKIVKDKHEISNGSIMSCLGVSNRQVKYARRQVKDILTNNSLICPVQRKTRKDFIRLKLEKYVFDYLSDDEYTRLDTKQDLVDVEDPRTGELITVHQRIYRIVNKEQQYEMFKSSDYYKEFQKDNPGSTVGYEIYAQARNRIGRFVKKPLNESCVDERMSLLL